MGKPLAGRVARRVGDIVLNDLVAGAPAGEPLTGHTGAVLSVAFGTGPDGRLLLASGSEDKTVRLWEPATGFASPQSTADPASCWQSAIMKDCPSSKLEL